MDIKHMRQNYDKHTLRKSDLKNNPLDQFRVWFQEAKEAEVEEPNAMTLSTVSEGGIPSSRIMLLKEVNDSGFVFFTNFLSRKAQEINANEDVAIVFLWLAQHRQVRINGIAEQISREESKAYFQSRPRESQIGAWASPQSDVVISKEELDKRFDDITLKYKDVKVLPCPPHWGGYLIRPIELEYWQGRPSRLHDRFRYRVKDGNWIIERLAP